MSTIYKTEFPFKPETLVVKKNGKRLIQGSLTTGDYHINGSDKFILNVTVIASDEITANYEYYIQPQLAAVKIGTTAVATTYTVTGSDYFVLCDATGGAFTVTLPAARTRINQLAVTIKKTDATANAVNIGTTGGEAIDSIALQSLVAQNDSLTIMSDGSNYWIE